MATEAVVRKWGNSSGVILPKRMVEEKHLKENDKIVLLDVVKENDVSDIFGSLKGKIKMSGQEFKDMGRIF